MARPFFRSVIGSFVGALCGIGALAAVYAKHPALTMEMDRDPGAVTGLYGVERAGIETWAWSRRDASLALPGLDRQVAWSCRIRLRGARGDVATLPVVVVSVDGLIVRSQKSTNDYRDVVVPLPPRPGDTGATVSIAVSETVRPGSGDTRELGVMVDSWTCEPETGVFVRPPGQALIGAAAAGAAFGAALGLLELGAMTMAAVLLVLAIGQAVPMAWDLGPFTPFARRVPWLALWIAASLAVAVRTTEWALARRVHAAGRLVAILAFAVLYLKLLALLHPSKLPIDVVFHAHRLMWVEEGRFFFTQPMPSGVQFPYAIGLYVFALPWTLVARDYVALLRIIVSAAEASGYVLLYVMVSRTWEDRLAGAIAAALFAVVPRTFEIVGNANMTNAFGQSVALAVVAAAVLWRLERGNWKQIAAFTLLTAFALLCHISTLTLLGATLMVLAGLYWWRGTPDLRSTAVSIVVALVVAGAFAVGSYYAHFGAAYRSAARVRATAAAEATASPQPRMALAPKAVEAGRLSVAAVGWPMIGLALMGALPFSRRGVRDRLSLAIAAWVITYAAFTMSVVVAPVGASFLRYAAEFITRVTLATLPAIVVIAALGAAAALRSGWALRIPAAALLAAAFFTGVRLWLDWLR